MLLLDEPLGALDAKLRKALQIELKTLQQEVGITFLYVTHDQEEALTMSDRLAVMNGGRIEQIGAPQDVYEDPETLFVADFLGVSNLMDATGRGRSTGAAGSRRTVRARGGRRPERRDRPREARDPAGAVELEPHEADSGPNCLPGMVERVVYVGSAVQVLVRVATGETLQALVTNTGKEPCTSRDPVQLHLPVEALRVLPVAGEEEPVDDPSLVRPREPLRTRAALLAVGHLARHSLHQRIGLVVIRTKSARPASRADEEAAARAGEGDVVHPHPDEQEVRLRRVRLGARLAERSASRSRPASLARRRVSTSSAWSRLARPAARAARLTLKGSRTTSIMAASARHDRVAEAEAGEPEDLRERAHDDDGEAGLDVAHPVDAHLRIDVLDVGLVDDDRAAVGDAGEQALPLLARHGEPVGLFGSQSQTSRASCSRAAAARASTSWRSRGRHLDDPGAGGCAGRRVEPVGRGRLDDHVARLEEGVDDRGDERLDAVGRDDPLGRRPSQPATLSRRSAYASAG